MHQRALQGYEKALGTDNISTYTPALNTLWAFASLYEKQGDLPKARIMYVKALLGYEKVVGPDHPTSQSLREILQGLDSGTEKEAVKGIKKPVSNPREEVSRLGSEGAPSTSRRHKLFRKLGLR
ncbi:hypothetical protein V493_00847 [Pseudogymnoascus sp. VKM F-4281 (FW-2241)]|nr:hypothetical protein V493_00847 [Pseudogymnoascus sp. VKM F-4281 (FW-2241)]